MTNPESPEQQIKAVNNKMINNKEISSDEIDKYFEDFKKLFLVYSDEISKSANADQKRALVKQLCDLNGLYGIQIKYSVDLPEDVRELAYDLDNPDYPGLDYVVNRVVSKEYKVLNDASKS